MNSGVLKREAAGDYPPTATLTITCCECGLAENVVFQELRQDLRPVIGFIICVRAASEAETVSTT